MLDNFIRGGQIFLHNVAMFKQVVGKTFAIALLASVLITGYMTIPHFQEMDFYAGSTYIKAQAVQWVYDHRVILHKNAYSSLPKIDAYDKKGLYMAKAGTGNVIKSTKFKSAYRQIEDLVYQILMTAALITGGFIVLVFFIWTRFGRAAKESRNISGGKILSAREVKNYLRRHKLASDILLGSMPLVKDSETKHILLTGSTGSGKTNCLHGILPQIRARKQPAIVIDLEGSLVTRYYRPEQDIIINPYDTRSHRWDFWGEVADPSSLEVITNSLFPGMDNGSSEVNGLFEKWAGMFFKTCVLYLQKKSSALTINELYNMLHIQKPEVLMPKLKGTPAAAIMDLNNEKNITAHNIRANAMAHTEWLSLLAVQSKKEVKEICFKKWFEGIEAENKDRWIFLTATPKQASVLLPLISLLMDIAVSSLMEKGEDKNRRIWFIIDELAALNKMPVLEKSLTRLRKYGGCILAATQMFKQLFAKYGRDMGSIMIGQFNTNIIFRNTDIDEATIISKRAGEVEYLMQQKNTSYGAHEHRDGISYSEQEKRKSLLKPSDIVNLKPLEAFVLLPEPQVAVSKITTKLAKETKSLQPFFVPPPTS